MREWPLLVAKWFIGIVLAVGLAAPLISTDKVLLQRSSTGSLLWYEAPQSSAMWSITAPLPYLPHQIDKSSLRWRPPGHVGSTGKKHWLGTSKLGKDVATGLVWGCRTAIVIGLTASVMAICIGLLLGVSSGYFGNMTIEVNLLKALVASPLVVLGIHYFTMALYHGSGKDLLAAILCTLAVALISRLHLEIGPKAKLAIDNWILRLIQIRKSIPIMYLLLSIGVYIGTHTMWSLGIVIGCIIWTAMARHGRAYTLDLLHQDQIRAVKALGYSHTHIILRHIVPQVWSQMSVLALFAMSTAILLEATLSYLGLGLSGESLTWGNMISEARSNPSAWWMAIFPGIMISLTLISLRTIGRGIKR